MLISALPSLPGGVGSLVATGGGGTIQAEASVKCFILYEGGETRKKTSSVLKQI